MADGDTAEQRQAIRTANLGAVPAASRPILHQPMQPREIERPGGRCASCEAVELFGHLATGGREPLVPIAAVEARTPILKHGSWQPIGKSPSRQCSIGSVPKELLGRYRKAEFDQPNIR